jgi:cbb3-type cytochrome oxidase subunit 3
MRELIITLMIAMLGTAAMAETADSVKVMKNDAAIERNDAVKTAKKHDRKDSTYVPTYVDSESNGVTVESESSDEKVVDDYDWDEYGGDMSSIIDLLAGKGVGAAISISWVVISFFIMLVLIIFMLPVIIIILILHNKRKRERERNRIIEKAIDAGLPLSDDLINDVRKNLVASVDRRNKGIKNMCLGCGLFIFLWALTETFSVGCIGLLVFFSGLGQFLTSNKAALTSDKKAESNKETVTDCKSGDSVVADNNNNESAE